MGSRLQNLLREFKSSDKWALWDLPQKEQYYEGRVCLMGDSCHAAVPHLGSGAGMAMEDAYILSNLVGTVNDPEDFKDIFKAYDAVRRPRTQKLVQKSREAGLYHAFELENVGDDLEALRREGPVLHHWVWGIDLEGQLEEAKAMLSD